MKRQAATFIILTLLAVPGLVNAQSRQVIKAQVPFDFIVNGNILPAGECAIEAQGEGQTYLMVSSGSHKVLVLPNATESLTVSAEPKLVFHRYGDRYFLSSISRQGNNRGYGLPAGKAEKELRAQKAAEGDVTLAAAAQ
ncbi:MAG TPA: hypothetical protein VEK84_11025 [Terriglobales bacterium]|nr:hypothetical protein [Terriglobales bacterium]